jgi:hypothetical protein
MNKFDEIMSIDVQQKWLEDLNFVGNVGSRAVDSHPEWRLTDEQQEYTEKYRNFRRQPYYGSVIEILRIYVRLSIPVIHRGENLWWACSIHPQQGSTLIARINMAQTVFEVNEVQGAPCFSWYIRNEQLEKVFGKSLSEKTTPVRLQKGGRNQVILDILDEKEAFELINNSVFLREIRKFNLQVARAGSVANRNYHCFALADDLLDFQHSNQKYPKLLDEFFVEEDEMLFEEGRIVELTHQERERNRTLTEAAKMYFIRDHKRLFCEVCGFDFEEIYGELGANFIEVHHTKPLVEFAPEGELVNSGDLVMLCANCHRMIHRLASPSLEELRKRLRRKR